MYIYAWTETSISRTKSNHNALSMNTINMYCTLSLDVVSPGKGHKLENYDSLICLVA